MAIVDEINDYILSLIPQESVNYYSSDTICKTDDDNNAVEELYDTEFLNTINCSGIPPRNLQSQGQPLSNVGIYLPTPVFSHGQLYVALSRARSLDGLKILNLDNEKNTRHTTTNVVYVETFQNVGFVRFVPHLQKI